MIYTNMKGAMQYSTEGVNNDYVLCVSRYLHTRHCSIYTYAWVNFTIYNKAIIAIWISPQWLKCLAMNMIKATNLQNIYELYI